MNILNSKEMEDKTSELASEKRINFFIGILLGGGNSSPSLPCIYWKYGTGFQGYCYRIHCH